MLQLVQELLLHCLIPNNGEVPKELQFLQLAVAKAATPLRLAIVTALRLLQLLYTKILGEAATGSAIALPLRS